MIALVWVVLSWGKAKDPVMVFERDKPGEIVVRQAKLVTPTNPGEPQLVIKKGPKYVIPEEKKGTFELVRIKGKILKGWFIEKGQVVALNDKLSEPANPLMDHKTVTAVVNRTSAKRLSAPKLPKGDLYIWLIMGVVVGTALGYILFPSFNHPAPVVDYCIRLGNGTLANVAGGKCP